MSDKKYIDRNSLLDIADYKEIFDKEKHHNHKIVDDNGVYRWEENKGKTTRVEEKGLNSVVEKMMEMGLNKNSEEWRALYRNMGYSLSGYWEVFFWDWNNSIADEYCPV